MPQKTKTKHYIVRKTYYCDVLGMPCVQIEDNIPYNSSPPDCENCEIPQKPEPADTGELYDVVTIVPGKGTFGKTLAEKQS